MRDLAIEAVVFFFLGLSIVLCFFDFIPFWTIPFIWLIVISVRYQVFGKLYGVNNFTIRMKMEDKFFNEFQYQIKKMGYNVVLFYVGDTKIDFKTNAPKSIVLFCKMVTFLKMMWCPGWRYRDLEDEVIPIPIESSEEAGVYEV